MLCSRYADAEEKLAKMKKDLEKATSASDQSENAKKALLSQFEIGRKELEDMKKKLAEAQTTASAAESKRAALERDLNSTRDNVRSELKARSPLFPRPPALRVPRAAGK